MSLGAGFDRLLAMAAALRGDRRMAGVLGNAMRSFLVKIANIASVFALLPIAIRYLTPSEYGVWLTIGSILAWVNLFDVGLGNGLRGKLTEAEASGDESSKARHFNTAMALLGSGAALFYGFYVAFGRWIDWPGLLNAPEVSATELRTVVDVALASLLLQLVLKIVGVAFIAIHKAWLNELMLMLSNAAALVVVLLLSLSKPRGTLLEIAWVYSLVPVLVLLGFYAWGALRHPWMRPDLAVLDRAASRAIAGTGVKFFLLQVLGLVVFATSNLVIARLSGPESVTVFNVAYRYFSPINQLFLMVTLPLWGAYTDALARGDREWSRQAFRRMRILFLAVAGLCLLMLAVSPLVYRLWLGAVIEIPWGVSIPVALYFITCNLVNVATSYLNGVLVLRLQLLLAVAAAVAYLPLTLLLDAAIGWTAVCWSIFLLNLVTGVVLFLQAGRLIGGRAEGIWAK